MNTKDIGNITEVETILAFLKLGFNVLQPYGDNARYDIVVEKHNGEFMRIQCKTSAIYKNGKSFHFDGRSSHRRNGKFVSHTYTKDEIDYFATTFNGIVYLVPVEECNKGKSLYLEPCRTHNQHKAIQASNYTIEKITETW